MERFKSKTEPTKASHNDIDMNRREVMAGLMSAVSASILPSVAQSKNLSKLAPETSPRPKPNPFEMVPVSELLSSYQTFSELVRQETEIIARDADILAERAGLLSQEQFDNQPIVTAIKKSLDLTDMDEVTAEAVRSLFPYDSIVESRLVIDAENESTHAYGLFQIMPQTWQEHKPKDGNKELISDQIKVADALLQQSYRYLQSRCNQQLTIVCQQHFAGDEELCNRYFCAPLVFDAYHAGMGLVADILEKFERYYADVDIQAALTKLNRSTDHYDIYTFMTHTAVHQKFDDMYQDKSALYFARNMAAKSVVENVLEPDQQIAFLGHVDEQVVSH